MIYYIENTLKNLTLIRTISDSFPNITTYNLFNWFKHQSTILLVTGEQPTPQFKFRSMPRELTLSETELKELVFTLSLEQ